MTFYTLFALILLPILGGLIAWAGDVIGYRLGKSRRSLLGLRPRTTARLVGVFVGALLVIATWGVAAMGSASVREALFSLGELRVQRNALMAANEQLRQKVEQARQMAAEAKAQMTTLAEQRRRLEEEVAQINAKLSGVRRQLAASRKRLNAAQQELKVALSEKARLSEAVTKLRSEQGQLLTRYNAVLKDLSRAERRLSEAQAQNAQLLAGNKKLRKEQEVLRQANVQLVATNDNLRREQENLKRDIANLSNSIEEFRKQVDAAKQAMEDAKEAERAFRRALFAWQINASQAAVMYEPGQEIFRAVVDTDQTQDQMEASLWELLHIASGMAAARGAVVGANGRAVKVLAPVPPGRLGEEVAEEDIVYEVARRIRLSSARRFIVSIRSLRRVFEGEMAQVQVELWGTPNSRLFKEGEVIHSIAVDGASPRGEILRQLLGLLAQTRRILHDLGAMPDPASGQFFTVPAEDILACMDKATGMGEQCTVEVVAAVDVYKVMPKHAGATVRLQVVRGGKSASTG